jgi:hypothetical protein
MCQVGVCVCAYMQVCDIGYSLQKPVEDAKVQCTVMRSYAFTLE